jgi:LmbE family N-acetylglucosaminyl deacetylase
MKKVLAIGSHFDDIELGCSGALLNHVKNGDDVQICVITSSDYNDQSGHDRLKDNAYLEGKASALKIGATKLYSLGFPTLKLQANDELIFAILKVINEVNPDIIYTHTPNDVNCDHIAVAQSVLAAGKKVKTILLFRPNVYSAFKSFDPKIFVDITEFIDIKTDLIKSFESEAPKNIKWAEDNLKINSFYGLFVGCSYAEGFEIVKYLLA